MFKLINFVKHSTKKKYKTLEANSFSAFLSRSFTLNHYGLRESAEKDPKSYPYCLEIPPRIKTVKVYRFNPEDTNNKPYLQKFEVDLNECGLMVLDVLHYIKATFEPTLSFRRACGEGVCGTCSMNINGVNTLACITKISTDLSEPLVIYPLPHAYVIRDLVPDMSHFLKQYKIIEPCCNRPGEQEYIGKRSLFQSERDRKKVDGTFECILCGCCSFSCPPYWWSGDKYLGPAVLLHAYRWVIDSRDLTDNERLCKLRDYFSLFRCKGVYNCTKTCPKGLNPAKAISELKSLTAGWKTKEKADIQSPPPLNCLV